MIQTSSAVISDCGLYRYRLERQWAWPCDGGYPITACFVMLNPSTADADVDDPTVRKCVGFARRWGCQKLIVVNLFGIRSTDPAGIDAAADPVGPENDRYLRDGISSARIVVAAWGAMRQAERRADVAARILLDSRRSGGKPVCLGRARNGAPRHPLMLPYSSLCEAFTWPPNDNNCRLHANCNLANMRGAWACAVEHVPYAVKARDTSINPPEKMRGEK